MESKYHIHSTHPVWIKWPASCIAGEPRVYPRYGDIAGSWAQGNTDADQFVEVISPPTTNTCYITTNKTKTGKLPPTTTMGNITRTKTLDITINNKHRLYHHQQQTPVISPTTNTDYITTDNKQGYITTDKKTGKITTTNQHGSYDHQQQTQAQSSIKLKDVEPGVFCCCITLCKHKQNSTNVFTTCSTTCLET
ncbi:unnamed protein product [Mytilus edulis]|uniref:Uncharacterized protein n=1 Tax=Mytilus edulis TaxID=6550 RepID=A0A8S3T787_MYTED|nr:unnamed protein product [Mytilus edulis]